MAKSDQIKDGDQVQLDGIGPIMSVQETNGDSALCMWLDEAGQLIERWLPLRALHKVQADDGP